MNDSLLILARLMVIPLLVCAASGLLKSSRALTKLAAVLFWAQLVNIFTFLYPVLCVPNKSISISSDFSIEHTGALFAMLTQVVVACAGTHAIVFFKHEPGSTRDDGLKQVRLFYVFTSLFLLAMTSVFFCNNLGFLWIAVEATTLCSAPLVLFHMTKHSLEAAWKYVIICSVGIAFALLGTIFIFASSQYGPGALNTLNIDQLCLHGASLQYVLLRLGFLVCLIGYGTKAGIFPLHSWLPDAHSEAPAPASAMLSGSLLNCALFAIWRLSQIVTASGHGQLVSTICINAGTLTVLAASLFLVRQHGLKRLLAYSSIENVGLMLVAIGFASPPLFFLLAVNHSIVKVALFLLSGNILQQTGSKSLDEIRGLLSAQPIWSVGLMAGACAITGSPPFGSFVAEWQLLVAGSTQHYWLMVGVLLASLAISFLAIAAHLGKILLGTPRNSESIFHPLSSSIVPIALLGFSLVLGITTLTNMLR